MLRTSKADGRKKSKKQEADQQDLHYIIAAIKQPIFVFEFLSAGEHSRVN
ncbi:hypothetical protein I6F15_30525 [Bradyrhizobium sp. BRP14]|nr:hypothetical protein [Bradyrhizobium sp. BRP14]